MMRGNKVHKNIQDKDAMKTRSQTPADPTVAEKEKLGMAFSRAEKENGRSSRNAARGMFVTALFLLALLAGCSSDSKPTEMAKPEAPKGPDLLTARSAFQKVYLSARGWQGDAKPYRIESIPSSDGNGHDGKAAIWRGSFASAAQRSEKSYTWSGSAADGAPSRGVNPGTEDSYNSSNSSTQVFDMAFLKIDSDQAVATAQKHGGDKILDKAPDTPVFYTCDWNHNTNELVWHVMYGASRETVKLTVAVNASTGEFIRVEK
jgi:hypothetical protein